MDMIQKAYDNSAIGVIEFSKEQYIDELLSRLVTHLQTSNLMVAGFVQRSEPVREDGCCGAIFIDDILSGDSLEISQALGKGARGCRLNPIALADATSRLLTQLELSPDIVVLNRFGKGESEGQGFRAVVERTIDLNIKVLTAVRQPYTYNCLQFAGEFCQFLPPEFDAVVNWCDLKTRATGYRREISALTAN